MYYDKIRHRHSQVLAATGLTPVEFDALLVTFKCHLDEYYVTILFSALTKVVSRHIFAP